MSARRPKDTHALPPNPIWVSFPRSDGDSKNWPPNRTCVVDNEGNVNWMRAVGINESLSIHWRKSVGPKIAEVLGLVGD